MINRTQLILKFENKNWLKISNFLGEFKNMSNLIEASHAGTRKNHICLTYLILVYSNHCNQPIPGLQNA